MSEQRIEESEDDEHIKVDASPEEAVETYRNIDKAETFLTWGVYLKRPISSGIFVYIYWILFLFIPLITGWVLTKIGYYYLSKSLSGFTDGQIPVKKQGGGMSAKKYEDKNRERYFEKRQKIVEDNLTSKSN